MKGWYFAAKDRKLRYNDNRVALRPGAGPVAFRVTLGGALDHSDDKSAAQTRTYDSGGVDCTNTLIEFACCAAMGAMLLTKHDDPRSWAAIEAALAWMLWNMLHGKGGWK